MSDLYDCPTCEASAPRDGDDLRPLDPGELADRVYPGERFTDRACRHCDGLVYPSTGDESLAIVDALLEDEERLADDPREPGTRWQRVALESLRRRIVPAGDSSSIVAQVLELLDRVVELEGAGSDLHDVASGVAALLRSTRPRPGAVHASDLVFLAGAALREAGEQSAAVGSLVVAFEGVGGDPAFVRMESVVSSLEQVATASVVR